MGTFLMSYKGTFSKSRDTEWFFRFRWRAAHCCRLLPGKERTARRCMTDCDRACTRLAARAPFISVPLPSSCPETAARPPETSALPAGAKISASRASSSGRIISAARASSAPNPAAARAALLAREWPIGEIAPYIRLVEAIEEDSAELAGSTYRMSEAQVKAILDLRLHRLTALGRDEIGDELKQLAAAIEEFLSILADRVKLYGVIREELVAVRDQYATPRVSQIAPAWDGIEDEDLIEREAMVVTVTLDGEIKRTPLSTFRAQNRGGKGRAGMATKQEDAVATMFVTSTHTPVLFFSTAGKVYRLKVWRLPEGGAATRGRPVVNMLPALDQGETIATVLPLPEDEAEWGALSVVFATAKRHWNQWFVFEPLLSRDPSRAAKPEIFQPRMDANERE